MASSVNSTASGVEGALELSEDLFLTASLGMRRGVALLTSSGLRLAGSAASGMVECSGGGVQCWPL